MAYVANEIMQKYGLKTLPTDNFRYYSGEGADMLMQRALKDAGDKELIHYEEGRRLYREMFAADPMYKVVPYEGMPETLKELKKRGIRLAVCSNKPHPAAVKVIAQLYGDDFDMVLGQSDAIRRKPVNRQVEGMIHFAGLMLLMALMVIVMYNDILKIF